MLRATDAETLQKWRDYLDEYSSNLTAKKQELDVIINDPDIPQADKDKANQDYSQQLMAYTQMENKYAELLDAYEHGDPLPSTVVIAGGDGCCGFYRIQTGGQLYVCTAYTVTGLNQTMCLSEHFDIRCTNMAEFSTTSPPVSYTDETSDYYDFGCKFYTSDRRAYPQFTDTKGFLMQHTDTASMGTDPTVPHYFWTRMYKDSREVLHSQGSYTTGAAMWVVGGSNSAIYSNDDANVDTENPWDYYNNEVLPNIDPDNAVFPGGYTPEDPDDAPSEPQDLPHDDGTPPDLQKDRRITVPMAFITQYALDAAELTTIGNNLWQSWLTPNTDVWKNFFLPYAQDFGTLNISACMDYIISLKIFPFEFTIDMFVNNINGVRMGTGHTDFLGATAPVIKSQIYCLDLGECEVELPAPYNDFRDMYNCSILCCMPYCGSVELNPVEVIGRTLHAYYYIDFQSGGCTCVITCDGDAGEYVIASKSGQIGFNIPMTATNAGQLAAQFAKDSTETIGTLAGWFFDTAKNVGNGLFSMGGSYLNNKSSDEEKMFGVGKAGFDMLVNSGQKNVNTALELVNQSLDRFSRSGINMPMLSGGSSAESFMFADCVSLQIRRGKYAKPDNYPHSQAHVNCSSNTISYYKGKFKGEPDTGSNTDKGLCKFTGVDSTGLTCNNDERVEILALLESGIYI